MRRLATFAVCVVLGAPLVAGALTSAEITAQIQALLEQVSALQAQLRALQGAGQNASSSAQPAVAPSASAASCAFARTLALGAAGQDVFSLQKSLAAQGILGNYAEGLYDDATASAVGQWQLSHGIVTGGTAETTGFGIFGPRTRSLFALNCSAATPSNTSACPWAPKPATPCAGNWRAVTTDNGCTTGWQCVVPLSGAGANACATVTLACPAGTHLEVGANCAQSCKPGLLVTGVSTATQGASCPVYTQPACAYYQHLVAGDYDASTGCFGASKCVTN